jgi:hypothetical protein
MNTTANIARITCAAILLIGGCTSVDEDEKSAAQSAVKQHLTDPDSAQFSDETVVWNRNSSGYVTDVTVCGWVNSKNTFGGYAGKTRFVATSDSDVLKFPRVHIESDSTTSIFEIYWNPICGGNKKASD